MTQRTEIAGLKIDTQLAQFVAEEAAPGTGIGPDQFWQACADILAKHAQHNRDLLAKREDLQSQIDAWHVAQKR